MRKEGAKHVEALGSPPLDAGSNPAASIFFMLKLEAMKKAFLFLALAFLLLPQQLKTRWTDHGEFSRFVIEASSPIDYDVKDSGEFYLSILLKGSFSLQPIPSMDSKLLSSLQVNETPEGILLTLRFKKSSLWKLFELEDPFRIVVDVRERPQGKVRKFALRTIVLDPGHGGQEDGAVGRGGTKEKDLALTFCKELKKLLESSLGVRVILTRKDDSFVGLDERTAIANNAKADMFISIHFNYSDDPTVKGPETYFLSSTATDRQSRLLAYKENMGEFSSAPNSDIGLILWDMAQSQYLYQSSKLAEAIQRELASEIGVTNRGVKQAPFAVLMGATMPAILVEVDFISNPTEEKLLLTPEYRKRLEQAILRGIKNYMAGLR